MSLIYGYDINSKDGNEEIKEAINILTTSLVNLKVEASVNNILSTTNETDIETNRLLAEDNKIEIAKNRVEAGKKKDRHQIHQQQAWQFNPRGQHSTEQHGCS